MGDGCVGRVLHSLPEEARVHCAKQQAGVAGVTGGYRHAPLCHMVGDLWVHERRLLHPRAPNRLAQGGHTCAGR